jgi:hypothetical protein
MGHEHIRVFLNHYHKALTPEEAQPYWEILPLQKDATPKKKMAKKRPRKRVMRPA